MKKIVVRKQVEVAMPFLDDKYLKYTPLSSLSVETIREGFKTLGYIGDLKVVENKQSGAVLAGMPVDDRFEIIVQVSVRTKPVPFVPTQLKKYKQVGMVNVSAFSESEGYAKQGHARAVYNLLATKFDLVSDHYQYLGAKRLWKSLSKETDINIYVFDGNIGDYLRDSKFTIIRYNGKNLDDKKIWHCTDASYENILLVASIRKLI